MIIIHVIHLSISNPVSRRGYLEFCEQDTSWHKKFIVSRTVISDRAFENYFVGSHFQVIRRPYVLIYNNDKDPVSYITAESYRV